MPPLEALACGVRIVVPENVGILDGLRSHGSSVYYYRQNDYDHLCEILSLAVSDAIGKHRHIVSEFNSKMWALSHMQAFGIVADKVQSVSVAPIEIIMPKEPAPIAKTVNQFTEKSGAILVAYGDPARKCAERLLTSWSRFMPDYPIALVSDSDIASPDNHLFINHADTDIGARSVKTQLYSIAPSEWDNVLYLDADTEIIADVSQLFRWLDSGWEFIICTNPFEHKSLLDGRRPDNGEELDYTLSILQNEDILQPNGGVFGFHRNDRTQVFMETWYTEWQRWSARDQMALLRALHHVPLAWLLLGNEWNTIIRSGVDLTVEMSAGILHYPMNARRWAGIIYGKLDSQEAWNRVKEWESKK